MTRLEDWAVAPHLHETAPENWEPKIVNMTRLERTEKMIAQQRPNWDAIPLDYCDYAYVIDCYKVRCAVLEEAAWNIYNLLKTRPDRDRMADVFDSLACEIFEHTSLDGEHLEEVDRKVIRHNVEQAYQVVAVEYWKVIDRHLEGHKQTLALTPEECLERNGNSRNGQKGVPVVIIPENAPKLWSQCPEDGSECTHSSHKSEEKGVS